MSSDELHTKIDAKPKWALSDLLHVLEKEFDVELRVVSGSDNDPVGVKGLANDPELRRSLEASREDRRTGRMYSGQAALEMLRKINRENQEGANL